MAVEADSLSKRHEEDFARFKRSVRKGPLKPLIALLGLALLLYFFLAPRASLQEIENLHIARKALLAVPAAWAADLAATHASGRRWLSAHGMPSEVRIYDFISQKIFRAALASASFYDQTGVRAFISKALTSIFNPLLRVSFMLIACWRIWLAAVLLALLWGALRTRPYHAQDLLGQTGNNRLFFSGIKTSLTDLSPDGAPNLHVSGLACPAAVSTALAKASPLAGVLERFQASNDTNLALTAVILKHADMPAYAPGYGESDA